MKNMATKRYGIDFIINTILCIILVIFVLGFIGVIRIYNRESFVPNINNNNQLVPEDFTKNSREQLLLYKDYDVKKNTDVTKNNNFNIWKDYPVYPSSFKQITNNRKTWTIPDNGLCSPAEFCGTPYENTEQREDIVSKAIPIDSNVTRVNWWASNSDRNVCNS
jgi:hypothetical protein